MKVIYITLLIFFSSNVSANDWRLVSSNDGNWIKIINNQKQALLVEYQNNQPQLLLELNAHKPDTQKLVSASIKIDNDTWESTKIEKLGSRDRQTIYQLKSSTLKSHHIIEKMIAGINISIQTKSANNIYQYMHFSLHGFTVAFNDLLIANQAGSLDLKWLSKHKKDRELFCLLTTNISLKAMELRLQNKSYTQARTLISKTGYSIIDHNLGEIIQQVYTLPYTSIPYVPRAEKFLMFSRCMKQPFKVSKL